MPAPSFRRKRLRITFALSNNSKFEGTNSNRLVLDGFRATANVKMAGAPFAPAASLAVFGMRQSDMNALTMLAWKPLALQRNDVLIEAIDGDAAPVTVFSGQIISAGPDYSAAPDVCLRVEAVSIYFERISPAAPTSYTGPVDVATVVSTIARQMGKSFENNGVSVTLQNPYLPNTLAEQLAAVCLQANIDYAIDGNVIAITPKGQPRQTQLVVLAPDSGLEGYPDIDVTGIQVTCLFNAGIRFHGSVRVQSQVPKANGDWYVYALEHSLQSETPGGSWRSRLGLSEFGRFTVR